MYSFMQISKHNYMLVFIQNNMKYLEMKMIHVALLLTLI